MSEFDPKTSNTYGAVYWIKGKPNEKFSITINGDNVSYKIDVTIETEMWTGYVFYFTNIPVGTYTIQVTNDNINRLTITIVQPANCEEEWKTLYENMEDKADDGSIDLRLHYCSKDQTNYIKGKFPNIDVAKGQLQEILLLGYQLRILADNGNDTPITVEDVMSMFSANPDLLYLNLVLWKR